ncbi:UNVERIFIED_CONTAM: hypothetical protein RMT77_013755 [Armadillidium vulgare]
MATGFISLNMEDEEQKTSTPQDQNVGGRIRMDQNPGGGIRMPLTPEPVLPNNTYYGRNIVPPPLKYCLEMGQNFDAFLLDFELYCAHMYPNVTETWSRVLNQFLEGEMLVAFNNLDGGRIPYTQVKEKLRCVVKQASTSKDTLMNRYWSAKREKDESIINFSMRLDRLAVLAGIDLTQSLFQEMKKLKILDGLSGSSAARVKFASLTEPDLTVDRMIEIANNVELCFKQEKKVEQASTSKASETNSKTKSEVQVAIMERKDKKCTFCEKEGHLEEECYKKNKSCYCCGKQGHIIKDCRKRIAQEKNREQGNRTDRREQHSNNNRLQCPYCGEDHLMKDCADFKSVMSGRSGNE